MKTALRILLVLLAIAGISLVVWLGYQITMLPPAMGR